MKRERFYFSNGCMQAKHSVWQYSTVRGFHSSKFWTTKKWWFVYFFSKHTILVINTLLKNRTAKYQYAELDYAVFKAGSDTDYRSWPEYCSRLCSAIVFGKNCFSALRPSNKSNSRKHPEAHLRETEPSTKSDPRVCYYVAKGSWGRDVGWCFIRTRAVHTAVHWT